MDIRELVKWAYAERQKSFEECLKKPYNINNPETLEPRERFNAFSQIFKGADLLLKLSNESDLLSPTPQPESGEKGEGEQTQGVAIIGSGGVPNAWFEYLKSKIK